MSPGFLRPKGFQIIVAVGAGMGIGIEGHLPWHLNQELSYFRQITLHPDPEHYWNQPDLGLNAHRESDLGLIGDAMKKPPTKNIVIMGRHSWESIPENYRPLKNRINLVLSTDESQISDNQRIILRSFERALEWCYQHQRIYPHTQIWVIGGSMLYREAIHHRDCVGLYLTEIEDYYRCDIRFPEWNSQHLIHDPSYDRPFEDYDRFTQKNVKGIFRRYFRHSNTDELDYLSVMSRLIRDGRWSQNRTGIPTYRLMGEALEFDLRGGILPLLTTKSVPFRIIFEELKWFLKGDTNVRHLMERNVHIWDANTTREELDQRGFQELDEYSLPYGYGFLWRHFGADYQTAHTDYQGQGFDQIQYVLDQLRTQPTSRRIILSAWYPPALDRMVLPACHCLYQWSVDGDQLDVTMVQRSGDFFLGNPFNICSTALLTYLLGYMTHLHPRRFKYWIHDCHLYETHLEVARTQIARNPRAFPTIQINPRREIQDISDFELEDIVIAGYNPHPVLRAPMAV